MIMIPQSTHTHAHTAGSSRPSYEMHSIQLNAVWFRIGAVLIYRVAKKTFASHFAHCCAMSTFFLYIFAFLLIVSFLSHFISMQQWELIVLSKLKWNISSVTPLDFLEHLLVRLPISSQHTDISKIKKHAQAFISLAARGEFVFYILTHVDLHWACCMHK